MFDGRCGQLLPNDVSVVRCDAKRRQLRVFRSGSLLPLLNDDHYRACSPRELVPAWGD